MESHNGMTCPYVGLTPYSEEQADFFFGRERETRLLMSKLYAARLTLLYGASGVGKSSVLRAGVARTLRKEHVGVVYFNSWQNNPLIGLHAAVANEVSRILGTRFDFAAVSLDEYIKQAAETTGPLVIILDQFEEYFLYHPREDDASSFGVEFAKAVNRDDVGASFLISIREDAYTKLDRFKGRISNLFANYTHLDHMSEMAARAAIQDPLKMWSNLYENDQITIEPPLVDAVLKQVRAGQVLIGITGTGVVESPGKAGDAQIETPYLQLVMTRLWEEEKQAGSSVLRLETLTRLGGAKRIVRAHLDDSMRGLAPGEQDVAARAFRQLITPSGMKIAHTVSDLAKLAEAPEKDLQQVVEKLARDRILSPVAPLPGEAQAPRYEIFHDVLAPAVLDWRRRYMDRKGKVRLISVIAAAGLLVMIFLVLTFIAYQQKNVADHALAIVSQQDRSVPYFRAIMRGHTGAVSSAEFSPDGRYVVTGSYDNTARVWDSSTGNIKAEMRGSSDSENANNHSYDISIAFDPNGRYVATGSYDGTARVWNAMTGAMVVELWGHTSRVPSVAFSPNGMFVATSSFDNTARVWEASTGKRLAELRGHTDRVNSVAFSPDGKLVVTASADNTARVWEASTGKRLAELRGHTDRVNSVAFSPDGKLVVTASADNTARVWDTSTGKSIAGLRGHKGPLPNAEFSPDGKLVVTSSLDYTARVWEATTGKNVAELIGHTGPVSKAAFSPDGKLVVTGSYDNTARVWEVQTGKSVAEFRGHSAEVRDAAFSPDGRFVVTASFDDTARVWKIILPEPTPTPAPQPGSPTVAPHVTIRAFSVIMDVRLIDLVRPDGTTAVTTGSPLVIRSEIEGNIPLTDLLFTWYTCRTGSGIFVWGNGVSQMDYQTPEVPTNDCIRLRIEKGGAVLSDAVIYVNIQD